MASSLVLGSFDLLVPGSPVVMARGWDRGAPSPTVSQIESTVLDGSAVTGRSAGNRNIVIPILVNAPDRLTGAGLANQVLQFVDQATWPLTWTPDGGLPIVFDCYRASVQLTSDLIQDTQGWQAFTITAQAQPYGHSPSPVTAALAGSSVVVDGFNSTAPTATKLSTGGTLAASIVTTPSPFEGSGELKLTSVNNSNGYSGGGPDSYGFGTFSLTRTGLSISVASALSTGHLMFKSGTSGRAAYAAYPAYTAWAGTITTASSGTFPILVAAPTSTLDGVWLPLTVTIGGTIPAGATITGWSITTKQMLISNSYYDTQPSTYVVYFDDLRLYPAVSTGVSDTFGSTLLLAGVQGTARTPIALALAKSGGGTFTAWCVHSPPPDTPMSQPLIPLGGAVSPAAYTTAATVRYDGTYSVWVGCGTVGSSGTARTWTATFGQSVPSGASPRAVSASVSPFVSGMFYLGEITLPTLGYPAESSATTTVTVTSPNASDVFNDVLLLDTRGQTIIVNNSVPAQSNAWVDAPSPTVAFGGIWSGTQADRSDASSVAYGLAAGSTLLANPGNSTLIVYSPLGGLVGSATYYPRWLQEATS